WLLLKREFDLGRKIGHVESLDLSLRFAAMASQAPDAAAGWVDKLCAAEILFLDDPFKVKLTERVEETLFLIVARRTEGERDLYAEDVQINREGLVTQLLAQLSHAERSNPSFVSTWQGRTETDPMICIACLREFEEKRRSGKRISEQGRFMNDIVHKRKRNGHTPSSKPAQ